MTNFAEKIRPRIVFDLTIHRENFYRVDLYIFSMNVMVGPTS
jgi:hypothetical protein